MTVPAAAQAQEASKADFEDFSQRITGRWMGKVTWVTDWPGLGKKGETATCYLDAKMTADGNGILAHFYGGAGSQTIPWIYEAGAQRIRGTAIDSGGMAAHVTYHKENGEWIESGEGTLADGHKTKNRSTMHFSSDGKTLELIRKSIC